MSRLEVAHRGYVGWGEYQWLAVPVERRDGTSEKRRECQDDRSTDLFYYIEGFYNPRRRHSSLNYMSPQAYEHLYYQEHDSA